MPLRVVHDRGLAESRVAALVIAAFPPLPMKLVCQPPRPHDAIARVSPSPTSSYCTGGCGPLACNAVCGKHPGTVRCAQGPGHLLSLSPSPWLHRTANSPFSLQCHSSSASPCSARGSQMRRLRPKRCIAVHCSLSVALRRSLRSRFQSSPNSRVSRSLHSALRCTLMAADNFTAQDPRPSADSRASASETSTPLLHGRAGAAVPDAVESLLCAPSRLARGSAPTNALTLTLDHAERPRKEFEACWFG